jgi:hypothetical protein
VVWNLDIDFVQPPCNYSTLYKNIVTDLPKALLGNGSVNTFQQATMGAVFSVDEYNSSLIGSTTILATEGGVFYVAHITQQ